MIEYKICIATIFECGASKTNGNNYLVRFISFMFEQESYKREIPAEPSREGDLFHKYEIGRWKLSPRIYQIFAVSAVVNILVLVVFTQGNLLTRRGCDSPFTSTICQVVDTVYVGTLLATGDREYVDEAYEKIDLGDSEITYIDVSNVSPPLNYPEGYFQIANPEQFAMQQEMAANPFPDYSSGFPPISSNPTFGGDSLITQTPELPKVNPNPVTGGIPDSPFSVGGDTAGPIVKGKRKRGGRLNANANTNTETPDEKVAEAEPTPAAITTDAVAAVEVNKKPLTDVAEAVASQWAANEIDLSQKFTVALDGTITKDGKLDTKKSRFDKTKETGDPKMIETARQALEALGQSGFLTYLQMIGVEKINIVIGQDDNEITASITSTQKSPERAKSISSLASASILTGKTLAKNPSDEFTLLDGAKVSTEGNNFVLNFAIPKPIAQEMITRKLREAQAKKAQQPQPNGTAATKPNDNTAKR